MERHSIVILQYDYVIRLMSPVSVSLTLNLGSPENTAFINVFYQSECISVILPHLTVSSSTRP